MFEDIVAHVVKEVGIVVTVRSQLLSYFAFVGLAMKQVQCG